MSSSGDGGKRFALRLNLPQDLTTVLVCNENTTLEQLVDRALLKMRTLAGACFDKHTLNLTEMDGTLLPPIESPDFSQSKVSGLESVRLNLSRNIQPCLKLADRISHVPPSPTALAVANIQRPFMRSVSFSASIAGGSYSSRSYAYPRPLTEIFDDPGLGQLALHQPRSRASTEFTSKAAENSRHSIINELETGGRDISFSDIVASSRPNSVMMNNGNDFVNPEEDIVFILSDFDKQYSTRVYISDTIALIKMQLWQQFNLQETIKHSAEEFTLRYRTPVGGWVELFDEQQIFLTVSILEYWRMQKAAFVFYLTRRNKPLSKQLTNKKIGNVIGYGLYRFDYRRDTEIDLFRRKMISVRKLAVGKRDPFLYAFRPNIDPAPLTQTLMDKLKATGFRLHIRLHLVFSQIVKTLVCQYDDTPENIISSFVPKNAKSLPQGCTAEELCLKVCGAADYLVGHHRMIDYHYVRGCVFREEKMNLNLILKNTIIATTNTTESLQEDLDPVEDAPTNYGTHKQLSIQGKQESEITRISLWDIAKNFRLQVTACENLNMGAVESVYVEVGIYHGGIELCPPLRTHQVVAVQSPRWGAWLNFELPYYNLPRTSRLCITVWGRWNAKKKMESDRETDITPLGWANFLLMDYKGCLKMGMTKLSLWPAEKANPIGTCLTPQDDNADGNELSIEISTKPLSSDVADKIDQILSWDSLQRLSEEDMRLIWQHRHHLVNRAEALPKFLLSCRWNNLDEVLEAKRLIRRWTPLPPEMTLELLDANFADPDVRSYAVKLLETLEDHKILDFLLQLVQSLKYEPYLDCALARFLLQRSLCNKLVGHFFFWHVRAEMDDPTSSLRFALLLEAYLRGCGTYLDELIRQTDLLSKLSDISQTVKRAKPGDRSAVLDNELRKVIFAANLQIPLDPRYESSGLVVEKCRFMDSKKLPLWCVFSNVDNTGKEIFCIFKSGDDLRQDMLTLQMIRLMDKLWQAENLYLHMLPYHCLATGNGVGLIEVILNAETVSSIQLSYGGSRAAFRDQPLDEWLRKHNPDDKDYEKAVQVFTRSCAGYCVATYILGIGDRHNDNIMLSKAGNLFHIDFGHFLGNIKRKFGFKRERAPFVLTPDFVYVMGKRESENFKEFVELCVQAYLVIRRHAKMFINLFAMMLSTGIPELKAADDIDYLRDAFCLGKSEVEAGEEFRSLIFESLRLGWSTQLNWWIHNLAHSK